MAGNKNSGRRPVPKALKLARGNPGRGYINEQEPEPLHGKPVRPNWLGKDEKAIWDATCRHLEQMGILHQSDGGAIAGYVKAWCDLRKIGKRLEQEGRYHAMETGGYRRHAAVGDEQQALMALLRFAQELGLTPSARSRIKVVRSEKTDEDAFEEFMAGDVG